MKKKIREVAMYFFSIGEGIVFVAGVALCFLTVRVVLRDQKGEKPTLPKNKAEIERERLRLAAEMAYDELFRQAEPVCTLLRHDGWEVLEKELGWEPERIRQLISRYRDARDAYTMTHPGMRIGDLTRDLPVEPPTPVVM